MKASFSMLLTQETTMDWHPHRNYQTHKDMSGGDSYILKQQESIRRKHERNLDSQVNLENKFEWITLDRLQSQRNREIMSKNLMDIIYCSLLLMY